MGGRRRCKAASRLPFRVKNRGRHSPSHSSSQGEYPFSMCGRYTHLYTWKQLHRLLSLVSPEVLLHDAFNVAPTQDGPIVVYDEEVDGLALRSMRWGLVPSWAKDVSVGNSLINARAEGIEAKPSFRAAFKRRRCVIPMSGFYEWQKVEGSKAKQPYYIVPAAGAPTAASNSNGSMWLAAGLWESWHDPSLPKDAPSLQSFSVITTAANAAMAPVHDRMPVFLDPEQARQWASAKDGTEVASLLGPCPPNWLAFRRVSTLVNSPRNNSPQCIQESSPQDFRSIFDQRG